MCRQHQLTGQTQVDRAGLFQDEGQLNAEDRASMYRTRSAPLRPRGSMRGAGTSPTKQELHAFESLLEGTGAQMPAHLQLPPTSPSGKPHPPPPPAYPAFLCFAITSASLQIVTHL